MLTWTRNASNVGSVVEFSPATREARVRFPDVAFLFLLSKRNLAQPHSLSDGLIVAELMDRGSLQSYLRSDDTEITLAEQLHWILDLVSGVVYLRT